ncbi:hypothetical protein AB0E83_16740 [Streptomyces sp. NPDC035033]|uniref:hypothetical protein n=1 Tax=Streptomyces sp. NPDC035033 TaxID=3155368 RepID=UPI0033F4D76E
MISIDGRDVLSRQDIHNRYGYAMSALERWWAARETNGHPDPIPTKIGGVMFWDAEEWEGWDRRRLNPEVPANLRSRDDLIREHHVSRAKLASLWADRATNGHPPATRIGRTQYWDAQEWADWYARQQGSARSIRTEVDEEAAAGDPEELIGSSAFARILGHRDHSWVAKAVVAPPPGFPEPADWGDPVARKRPKWRRADAVTYATTRKDITAAQPVRRRRTGSTNSQPYPYHGDPRLALAREVLAQHPDATQTELIERLSRQSDQPTSRSSWRNIILTAREHPTDTDTGAGPDAGE